MKRRERLFDSVIIKQNLAYAAFLLVAIILFAGFASKCIQAIENEVQHSNAIALENMRYRIDGYAADIRSLSGTMVLDTRVQGIINSDSYEEISKVELSALQKEYVQYTLLHDRLNEFFVYFPHVGLCMRNQQANVDYAREGSAAHADMIARYGFSMEAWAEIVSRRHYGTNLFSIQGADGKNWLVMVRTLHYPSYTTRFANLVVVLDWEDVTGATLDTENGTVFIYSRATGTLVSPEEKDWSEVTALPELSGDENFGTVDLLFEGKDSIVSYSVSEVDDRGYGLVVARSSFLGIIPALTATFVSFCVLYVVISLSMVLVSVIRHYRWMRSISEALSGHKQPEWMPEGNEYQQISASISSLVHENAEAVSQTNEQHLAVRKSLLRQLVYISDPMRLPSPVILSRYGIVFSGNAFLIVAVRLQDVIDNADVLATELLEQSLAEQGQTTFSLYENNMLICIVNAQKEPGLIARVHTAVQQVVDKMTRQYRLPGCAAISDVVSGAGMLNAAFQQVTRVFEYLQSTPDTLVACYPQINALPADTLLKYSVETDRQLYASVTQGDFAAAYAVVSDTLERNSRNVYSDEAMMYLTSNILNTIVCAADAALQDQWTPPDEKYLAEIYAQRNMEAQRDTLREMLREICEMISRHQAEQRTRKTWEAFHRVLEYVQANYTDMNLSVSGIAEDMNLSTAALSRMFKTEQGENLSSYIGRLRLEKAKAMIMEGGKLEEIAAQCGFGSQRTFLRVFKQAEGLTPTQYRQDAQQREHSRDNR